MKRIIIFLMLTTFSIGFAIDIRNDLSKNFKTDFSKKSIDLELILDGGPGKDGIPPIDNPKFISIKKLKTEDEILGVFIKIGKEKRFYPYNILVWHEIVNDKIGNKHVAITFCPLCGSAIAYNREFNGKVHRFGVSGKLYESNLLMYDDRTESFWSQSQGKAVVGEYLGKELELIDISVLDFREVKKNHPKTKVLSRDTGFNRNYDFYPYGGYESNDDIYFPVSKKDKKYGLKDIFYSFKYNNTKFAFREKDFKNEQFLYKYKDEEILILRKKGEIEVIVNGKNYPGYYEMWFSWFTQNKKGIVIDNIE